MRWNKELDFYIFKFYFLKTIRKISYLRLMSLSNIKTKRDSSLKLFILQRILKK